MSEENVPGRAPVGERTDEAEGLGQGAGAGEVEPRQGQAGGGGVHMGVGERRGDQGAFEVDHLVHAAREGVGGSFGPHPGDMSAFDDHGGGERVGGAVDVSAAQQHGAVFGGALGAVLWLMGPVSRLSAAARPPAPSWSGRPAVQIRGGRASYGVDRTTVVRVDTPASVRIRVSRCSSSNGVATRTFRM